eukprot:14906678-Alexandrium_andersonii.AAC.1
MLAHQEAPQLEAHAVSGQLRLGHPEPIGDSSLDSGVDHPADLGHVEAHQEVDSLALLHLRDGLKLLLRPVEGAANLGELSQQVTARLRLPQAVALGLGLQDKDCIGVRP